MLASNGVYCYGGCEMDEIESKSGVTVDEVARYLSYLFSKDDKYVRPNVTKNSQELALSFGKTLKPNDSFFWQGYSYRLLKQGSKQTWRADKRINEVFDINSKCIYLLLSDIVKSEFNNSWAKIIDSIMNDFVHKSDREKVKKHYIDSNNNDSGRDLIKLIVNGIVIDDIDFIMYFKAEILKCIAHSINKAMPPEFNKLPFNSYSNKKIKKH